MKSIYRGTLLFLASIISTNALNVHAGEPSLREITYAESFESFPNPERGWHRHVSLSWFSDFTTQQWRDEDISLIWFESEMLSAYASSDIDDALLNQLQAGFDIARRGGMKVIFRASYEASSYADPPLSNMLAHISQLSGVLSSNADVLALVEAGFLGPWGEWHSSNHGNPPSLDARRQILFALQDAIPSNRMVVIRRPMFIRDIFADEPGSNQLTAATAYTGSRLARTGFHNDAFLTTSTDMGTYVEPGFDRTAELVWAGNHCSHTVFGGETGGFEPLTDYSLGTNAIRECEALHATYLNDGWYPGILDRWKASGHYDEIGRRLGYRFVLRRMLLSETVRPGGLLHLALELENVGFAPPIHDRPVEVILRNGTTNLSAVIDADARWWRPGVPVVVDAYLRLPTNMIEGAWNVLLSLPDAAPSLYTNTLFAMQLANSNTWEASTGYNLLTTNLCVSNNAPGQITNAIAFAQVPPPAFDADGDGMDDDWEFMHFGNSLVSAGSVGDDQDNDRFIDLHEFHAGTDPTDSASLLSITSCRAASTNYVIDWSSVSGKVYTLGANTNLLSTNWHPVTGVITATPPENAITVTPQAVDIQFFRIQVE